MKNIIFYLILLAFGFVFATGLFYSSGCFMSDEEYMESHPEVMERENWNEYFENPEVLQK